MSLFLITLALFAKPVPHEWRFQCTFQSDSARANDTASQGEIILVAPKGAKPTKVQFKNDANSLFGDDYGSKPANSRSWKVIATAFKGTDGFIRVTSHGRKPGHAAYIWMSGDGAGVFKGKYWSIAVWRSIPLLRGTVAK